MFPKLVIFFGIFLASEMVLAENSTDLHAVQYTNETFPIEIVKKNHFVMFYTTWCRYSQQLLPTWEQLAERMNGVEGGEVRIAKVDCDEASAICEQYNINGYPTLKFFIVDGVHIQYEFKYDRDERDLEFLTTFVNTITTLVNSAISSTPEVAIDQDE